MTLDSFISDVREELPALGDEDGLPPDANFRELPGWDSLAGLQLLSMIEMNYEVNVQPAELLQCRTMREVFETVKTKRAEPEPGCER